MAVVTMPSTPLSPQEVEFFVVEAATMNVSPFTGQQQVYDWGAQWMELRVTMPPMTHTEASAWIQFCRDVKGPINTFQFTTEFMTQYADLIGTRSWRMKGVKNGGMVTREHVFGFQFEMREAL